MAQMSPQQQADALRKMAVALQASRRTTLDENSGAPLSVRSAVGSANMPEDRLSTIRKFYPDAEPVDDDNFVFTDPKSKRPTLYNPEGFDIGDVASIAPEIAEIGGGVAGAALAAPPAVASAPVTGGASLATIPMAYGLGAAAGRELQGLLAASVGNTDDTRDLPQRLTDAAVTTGANAAGFRAGELLERGFRRAPRAIAPSGRDNARALLSAGVTPRSGAVTGSKGVQMVEQALASTPGGVGPIRDKAREEVAAIAREAGNVADQYAGAVPREARTVTGAGAKIRDGARAASERFSARQAKLYDEAFAVVDDATIVTPGDIATLRAYRDEIGAEIAASPNTRGGTLGETMRYLDGLIEDTNAGKLTFATLRRIRTDLGAKLDDPVLVGMSSDVRKGLRPVYGKITDATREIASRYPKGRELVARGDRYTRFHMNQMAETLQKISDTGFDEQVFSFVMRGADKGGSVLSKVRRNLRPQEWDAVSGTVLGRMGLATPANRGATEIAEQGGEFSVSTFLTNWNKVSPEARAALFGGTRYAALAPRLNNLVRVLGISKEADNLANTSGTARVLLSALGVLGIGGVGTGAAMGNVSPGDAAMAAGGVVTSTVLAPRALAKLITSPRFVGWLSQAARSPNTRGLISQLTRLGTVAKAEPAIREEIQQFRDALRPVEISP